MVLNYSLFIIYAAIGGVSEKLSAYKTMKDIIFVDVNIACLLF